MVCKIKLCNFGIVFILKNLNFIMPRALFMSAPVSIFIYSNINISAVYSIMITKFKVKIVVC